MKNLKIKTLAATAMVAASFILAGCGDREISKTETTSTSNDGTVKAKDKTVTQAPDGTVTKTEETKKTTTDKP